jgi:hypothetical protein
MKAIHRREHIMRLVRINLVAAVTLAVLASTAFAQSDIAPKTAVSFVGGAGSTASATGVALGGSWLFDVNDRASWRPRARTSIAGGVLTPSASVAACSSTFFLPVSASCHMPRSAAEYTERHSI